MKRPVCLIAALGAAALSPLAWTVAPSVHLKAVMALNGYGDVMTSNGTTLYGGDPFEHRSDGRNQRDDFTHSAYDKGKQLGPTACDGSTCAQLWQPFAAPAQAPSNRFWETVERQDRTRQWADKGYALYLYRGDQGLGDHTGQATDDFAKVEGEPEITRTLFLTRLSKVKAGAGIYSNIAKP